MSMKISSDTIGNQTCDLPTCSTVPQQNAPPCVPDHLLSTVFYVETNMIWEWYRLADDYLYRLHYVDI